MKKFLMRRIGFSLIAVLVTVLTTFTHVVAQEVPFYWDYINVNIDVQQNGDMLVTEEQKYVFKSDYPNQRYRYIRLDKVDDIKDVTVEENNQIIPSETGIENNQIWIRWRHELKPPASHTFILKYRVVGALHINAENTQVYWKAIFADRKAPVKAAKVRVKLPESLSDKVLDFKNFGTPATASQINPRTFDFIASQPIFPQKNLEIQVTFPSEILNLTQPNWQKSDFFKNAIADMFTFVIPFLILFPPLFLIFAIVEGSARISRHCPQCQTYNLKRTYEELVPATTGHTGKRKVICHCKNCSYHNEYEEVIPIDGGGGGG